MFYRLAFPHRIRRPGYSLPIYTASLVSRRQDAARPFTIFPWAGQYIYQDFGPRNFAGDELLTRFRENILIIRFIISPLRRPLSSGNFWRAATLHIQHEHRGDIAIFRADCYWRDTGGLHYANARAADQRLITAHIGRHAIGFYARRNTEYSRSFDAYRALMRRTSLVEYLSSR